MIKMIIPVYLYETSFADPCVRAVPMARAGSTWLTGTAGHSGETNHPSSGHLNFISVFYPVGKIYRVSCRGKHFKMALSQAQKPGHLLAERLVSR